MEMVGRSVRGKPTAVGLDIGLPHRFRGRRLGRERHVDSQEGVSREAGTLHSLFAASQ